MLREIVCDKFRKNRIEFHNGLNVILGTNEGDNSIGKSSFLLIPLIFINSSHIFLVSFFMPLPSLPITIATFSFLRFL